LRCQDARPRRASGKHRGAAGRERAGSDRRLAGAAAARAMDRGCGFFESGAEYLDALAGDDDDDEDDDEEEEEEERSGGGEGEGESEVARGAFGGASPFEQVRVALDARAAAAPRSGSGSRGGRNATDAALHRALRAASVETWRAWDEAARRILSETDEVAFGQVADAVEGRGPGAAEQLLPVAELQSRRAAADERDLVHRLVRCSRPGPHRAARRD